MSIMKQRLWTGPAFCGLAIHRLALCVGLVVSTGCFNTWAQSPDPDVNSASQKLTKITLANPGPESVTIRDSSGKLVKLATKTAAKSRRRNTPTP